MRIVVIAVGKVKERALRTVLDEYYKRIRRYTKLEEVELKDQKVSDLVPKFQRALDPRGRTVALEVNGKARTSEELAKSFERLQLDGVSTLTYLVGGSHGLPPEVSRAADETLSLSAMTLPHRLARVVLAEQIYRAHTIMAGEPYSH